jgi:hypothetical protein
VGGPQTLVAIPVTVLLVALLTVDTVLTFIALRVLVAVAVLPELAPVSTVAEVVTALGGEIVVSETD